MAVSYYSTPPVASSLISASYPMEIVAASTVYGTANVTQHRFKLEIKIGTTIYTTMYTVVDDETNKRGRFDVAEFMKHRMTINQLNADGDPVPGTTPVRSQIGSPIKIVWTVTLYEQYYLSGVWTENSAGNKTFYIQRGYTDSATKLMQYWNWYELTGREDILRYSGKHPIAIKVKVEDGSWIPESTYPYVWIRLTDQSGSQIIYGGYDRSALLSEYIWVQLFHVGYTDQSDFEYVRIQVGVNNSASTWVGWTVIYEFRTYKTVELCEDEEMVIMFQDRLFSWSFMSFTKKHRVTVNVENQKGELPSAADDPGRFRYNVKASDTLALNTDWMEEDISEYLIRDLVQSEHFYLVDSSDGSLEKVVLQNNSVRMKRRRTDNLIQYQMNFRKSIDNFIP